MSFDVFCYTSRKNAFHGFFTTGFPGAVKDFLASKEELGEWSETMI